MTISRSTKVDFSARYVDSILMGTLQPKIAETDLSKMAEGASISKIKVSATKQGQFKYVIK